MIDGIYNIGGIFDIEDVYGKRDDSLFTYKRTLYTLSKSDIMDSLDELDESELIEIQEKLNKLLRKTKIEIL